jgi:hypothetical protein
MIQNHRLELLVLLMVLGLIPERGMAVYSVLMASCRQMLSGFWEGWTKRRADGEGDSLKVNKELQLALWIRRLRSGSW